MTYRERREAKAERLRGWADKREQKAEAASQRAHDLAAVIPFGQPILVGHHSERRDRAYRARVAGAMDATVEHARKADEMRRRADGIEAAAAHAIYRDDPDELDQLRAKLARLEGERDRIKAYNASCRRGAADLELLDARQRDDLASTARVAGYMIGAKGEFPAYALKNLGGTIRATRGRITEAERRNGQ